MFLWCDDGAESARAADRHDCDPDKRVVREALRVMGLSESRQFAQCHQVLNRAVWSPLELLVQTFIPRGELVLGIDATIERRWGRKIAARGIYRDPVRSSESHFVKASGWRWISRMLLTPMPWALPVMTVLAPSERYYQERGCTPRTLLERSRQMLKLLPRRMPQRALVVVGDSAYAALDFLKTMQQFDLAFVTRLRLDAAVYEPAPPFSGRRLGTPNFRKANEGIRESAGVHFMRAEGIQH
jgi:hypothetical protein